MKLNLVQICDAGLVAMVAAVAGAIGGWPIALIVLVIGVLMLRRASKAPAETPEEAAEGRRRTYAQFQKDLHDPTGGAGISLLRDVD